ncbi:23198_t:CDS:2, partial [Gigaspora rosea]
CVFDEKPIFDPKEFKKMLEKAEPSLRDASGASLPTIVTLASTGLMVRRDTIARQKAQHIQAHMKTMIFITFTNLVVAMQPARMMFLIYYDTLKSII